MVNDLRECEIFLEGTKCRSQIMNESLDFFDQGFVGLVLSL